MVLQASIHHNLIYDGYLLTIIHINSCQHVGLAHICILRQLVHEHEAYVSLITHTHYLADVSNRPFMLESKKSAK